MDYLSEIASRTNITPVGEHNGLICCPFHDDSHPSLAVSLQHGGFYCFSCGAKGPFYKLIAQLDGISDSDAKKQFSEEQTALCIIHDIEKELTVSEESVKYIKEDSFLKKFVTVYDTVGETYLRARRINRQTISTFNLRWGTVGRWKDRVIIPVYSDKHKLLSFAGRSVVKGVSPKTRKLRSARSTLFGLNVLLRKMKKPSSLILVEGEFDAMYLQQCGYNAVSIMGTATLTPQQVALVLKYAPIVYVSYDADKRGKQAAKRDCERLRPFLPTVRLNLPSGKDPNDLSLDEVHSIYHL